MIAWSKWNEFESGTHFGAWMSRIVRYTALNRSRRRQLRHALPLASAEELSRSSDSPDIDPAAALSRTSELFDDRVLSALNQLQEEARSCLLLKVVAELDYAEISELIEIPEGTAMSHVSRAKVRLRESLSAMEDVR